MRELDRSEPGSTAQVHERLTGTKAGQFPDLVGLGTPDGVLPLEPRNFGRLHPKQIFAPVAHIEVSASRAMTTLSSVLAVQLSGTPLRAFGDKPERTIESDGGGVGREHLELDALDTHLSRRPDGVNRQLPAQPSAAIFRKQAHSQTAHVSKSFVRIADDVAPAHDRVRRRDRQHLDTGPVDEALNEVARALEWRAFDEADVLPLPRNGIHGSVEAVRVLDGRRNDLNLFQGKRFADRYGAAATVNSICLLADCPRRERASMVRR